MSRTQRWIPAWLVLGALVAWCGTATGISTSHLNPFGIPLDIDNDTLVDVNNIAMFVTNSGGFARDLESPGGPSGLFFPRGTDKTAVYACGLWFGGTVNDEVRVTVAEYSLEYQPGRIYPDGTWDDPADPRLRVYKVTKGDTESPDYLDWAVAAADGAPVDENGNPAILGDQMCWAVYNDLDPAPHSNDAGNSLPLGIEVRQTTFAFDRPAPLGNMVFVKFNIFNKGSNLLENCFVSLWSDPDLGGAGDDLVGCDTLLSLGYCYNETNDDEIYKSSPPAVGYDFFQGPIVPSPGDTAFVSGVPVLDYRNLPMTSFNKYINGTDPDSRVASYNYMTGLNRDGTPVHLFDDPTQPVTKFFHPGDPTTDPPSGWVDDNAADRRLMLSSGPFTMAPGDSQEVVVGLIVAQGTDRLSSITLLKSYDDQAQSVFDANFALPSPPPRPTLWARPYDQEIDLIWSSNAVGDVQVSEQLGEEYHHQGYNVYQGGSIAGPWKKLFTYDVDDSVALIYADLFDVDVGGIQRVIVQEGSNNGLVHRLRLTQDFIKGGPLRNHTEYFYAVTSYSYDVNHVDPVFVGANQVGWLTPALENSPQGIAVVPKSSTGVLEALADHSAGVSDGRVEIAYVDQSAIVNHDYRITFRPNPNEEEAETDPFVWDLLDVTENEVLLEGEVQQTEDFEDPVVNGFIPNVIGPPVAIKDWDFINGDRWISWVNWGMSGFNGGMGVGFEWFGSNLAPLAYNNKTVEVRFTDVEADWSDCATYRRDLGYEFAGIGKFPAQAWDVSTDPPRRLNICFVENATDDKPANLQWDPDDSGLGAREYLYLMNSDYNGGVDYGDETEADPRPWGPAADVLLGGGIRIRPGHVYLESNATWILTTNAVNTDADVFEFTTYPAGMSEGTVVGNRLDEIRVVPNPYLNQSRYELNQFDRIVKFTNLPGVETTIRIFTLGGVLVRTLEKESKVSSSMVWDLENEQDIPVASGIYIYHVDAKEIGTEVGKMVVFIEKERLNRF